MPEPPRISIVLPSYNAAATIARALESLAAQEYRPFEVVLADGGSSDCTVEIARGFEGLVTGIISERDRGPADAINKGFARCSGDLIGWLGCDDELMPGALGHVARTFSSNRCDVVAGACERQLPDGSLWITRPGPEGLHHVTWKNPFDQPSLFWRRALQAETGPLDLSLRLAFDWDLWCRFKKGGARFAYTGEVLSRYHFPETSLTSTGGRAHADESFEILRRHGPYRGMLAYAYRWLYRRYDLAGCYDRPPACNPARQAEHHAVLRTMMAVFGREKTFDYTWSFASKQERGLPWWT